MDRRPLKLLCDIFDPLRSAEKKYTIRGLSYGRQVYGRETWLASSVAVYIEAQQPGGLRPRAVKKTWPLTLVLLKNSSGFAFSIGGERRHFGKLARFCFSQKPIKHFLFSFYKEAKKAFCTWKHSWPSLMAIQGDSIYSHNGFLIEYTSL